MELALSQTSFKLLEVLFPSRAGAPLVIPNARKVCLFLGEHENVGMGARGREPTEAVDIAIGFVLSMYLENTQYQNMSREILIARRLPSENGSVVMKGPLR